MPFKKPPYKITTVYFDKPVYEALKINAEDEGRSLQKQIIHILKSYLLPDDIRKKIKKR